MRQAEVTATPSASPGTFLFSCLIPRLLPLSPRHPSPERAFHVNPKPAPPEPSRAAGTFPAPLRKRGVAGAPLTAVPRGEPRPTELDMAVAVMNLSGPSGDRNDRPSREGMLPGVPHAHARGRRSRRGHRVHASQTRRDLPSTPAPIDVDAPTYAADSVQSAMFHVNVVPASRRRGVPASRRRGVPASGRRVRVVPLLLLTRWVSERFC